MNGGVKSTCLVVFPQQGQGGVLPGWVVLGHIRGAVGWFLVWFIISFLFSYITKTTSFTKAKKKQSYIFLCGLIGNHVIL